MSHIVTLNVQVKDAAAVRAACQRLGLPAPVQGTTKLFSGEATGLAVQPPDWVYPIVFDTTSGQVKFDDLRRDTRESPRDSAPRAGVCLYLSRRRKEPA
jgi:hypothetical protein